MAWKRPHLKELTEMHHFHYSNNICVDNICAHRRQLLWREAGQPRASAPGPGTGCSHGRDRLGGNALNHKARSYSTFNTGIWCRQFITLVSYVL